MWLLWIFFKVFVVGEDEKNGVSFFWKIYLNEKRRKILFKGLNIIDLILFFFLDKLFFYYCNDILNFLDIVEGIKNSLIKVVSVDIKEDLYVGGVRVLGLVLKFFIGFLWRLFEIFGYILF